MSDQPSKTGLIASGALHGALLLVIIVGFAAAPKFDDAAESIPVATVTQSQFNEIMKGERNGTPVKQPSPEPTHAAAAAGTAQGRPTPQAAGGRRADAADAAPAAEPTAGGGRALAAGASEEAGAG